MSEIISRILKVAEYYGVKRPVDFAKKTGFSHQTATNYLKGNRQPNSEAIQIILQSFDKISPEWLMTGKEPMLKTQVPRSLVEMALPKEITKGVGSINEESKHTIEYLKMKEELLQELLKGKDKLIEVLEQKVKELEERKIKE